jgi:hypothetical protein
MFQRKEIFPWEHIKLGDLLWHNTLGFFCWGRSFKIHIEIKKGVVYVALITFYFTLLDLDLEQTQLK